MATLTKERPSTKERKTLSLRAQTKERKTLSLSREATQELKNYQRESGAPSLSAAVENVVRKFVSARKRSRLNAAIDSYYNDLTPSQVEEKTDWVAIAEADFPE